MLWRGGMQPCKRKLRLYGQCCAALGNSWQALGPAANGRRCEHSPPAQQAPQGCMPHARTGSVDDTDRPPYAHRSCSKTKYTLTATAAHVLNRPSPTRAEQIRTWPHSHVGPA